MIQLITRHSLPRLQWTLVFSFSLQFVSVQLAMTAQITRLKHVLSKPTYNTNYYWKFFFKTCRFKITE